MNRDGKMCLYAPDVTVGPDGRYYLYYVLDKVSVVSVAVCDTPAGRYEFYGYVHYEDGTRLGKVEVQASNVWEEYTASVRIPDGKQAIYLTYRGGRKSQPFIFYTAVKICKTGGSFGCFGNFSLTKRGLARIIFLAVVKRLIYISYNEILCASIRGKGTVHRKIDQDEGLEK